MPAIAAMASAWLVELKVQCSTVHPLFHRIGADRCFPLSIAPSITAAAAAVAIGEMATLRSEI
jgi:hypothetical protein